jgi:hypothetical protein
MHVGAVGHLVQQEPSRAKNTALIKPPKVLARFRAFLASLPNRDSRGSVELVQTAGRRPIHRRPQPAEIVRDPPWPGHGGRGPWILVSPALGHARRTRQRNPEPSIPIWSLSHKLKRQHAETLRPPAKSRQSALQHDATNPAFATPIPALDSIHPTYGMSAPMCSTTDGGGSAGLEKSSVDEQPLADR